MSAAVPRLRMFAGPNGSGKSTIKSVIVPESLALLANAVQYTNRAYIFDNSSHEKVWVAEVTNGEELEMKTDQMPAWFKAALWDKFAATEEPGP